MWLVVIEPSAVSSIIAAVMVAVECRCSLIEERVGVVTGSPHKTLATPSWAYWPVGCNSILISHGLWSQEVLKYREGRRLREEGGLYLYSIGKSPSVLGWLFRGVATLWVSPVNLFPHI